MRTDSNTQIINMKRIFKYLSALFIGLFFTTAFFPERYPIVAIILSALLTLLAVYYFFRRKNARNHTEIPFPLLLPLLFLGSITYGLLFDDIDDLSYLSVVFSILSMLSYILYWFSESSNYKKPLKHIFLKEFTLSKSLSTGFFLVILIGFIFEPESRTYQKLIICALLLLDILNQRRIARKYGDAIKLYP